MKIINHRTISFVFVTAIVSFGFAFGQDAAQDDHRYRSRDNYQPRTRTIAAVTSQTPQPEAQIKFRQMRFGRPPLVYLSFDVILRNDENSARWFLLPSNLGSGHAAIGQKGGVDTLEVFSPRGKGRVIIGRFLGTGGFNALLLPPRAELRLRLFPISYWGDPPANLELEIVIARQLSIGGDSAEKWFGKNPMSSVNADIIENAENLMRMRTSKRTPDHKEVAPQIEEDRRLTLQVSLEKRNE
jgi:hypothetical protein